MLLHYLPCETLMSAKQATNAKLRGIAATYWRFGGILNIHLTSNLPRNIPVKFKKMIWQNYGNESVAPFMPHPVDHANSAQYDISLALCVRRKLARCSATPFNCARVADIIIIIIIMQRLTGRVSVMWMTNRRRVSSVMIFLVRPHRT